jgi:hypothetical protein
MMAYYVNTTKPSYRDEFQQATADWRLEYDIPLPIGSRNIKTPKLKCLVLLIILASIGPNAHVDLV